MRIPPVKIYFPKEDKKEILQKIDDCLSTGMLTLGKNGKKFEEEFAKYTGTKCAIAVNSGTSAIEIPLRILGVAGKKVIIPTNTFFATALAVMHAGGEVQFADADAETFSIDVETLEDRITEDTVGIIVVHIAGIVTPKMDRIAAICQKHNLYLFEDAAHAHGSSLNGKMAGKFGSAASFSFYPTKVITSGEGGMIVTDSEIIRDEAILYRDQGKASFTANVHGKLGYNWRMSEPHAIIGLSHLRRLHEFIAERTNIARIYDEGLQCILKVGPLAIPKGVRSNYYKYIAILDEGVDRTELKSRLREEYGIGLSGEVYELPCHLQPIFEGKYQEGDFPKAEEICRRHICLPIFQTMTDEQANYVLSSLESVLKSI